MKLDMNALMKQAQQMQEQMARAQEEAKHEIGEASAGGGMVTVKANGAGMDGAGPVVAGGMLFVNSGYGGLVGRPGNVLLAFAPNVRLDLYADEMKKRSGKQ